MHPPGRKQAASRPERQKQKPFDMNRQTKLLLKSGFLRIALLCSVAHVAQAASATVLAPVVDVKGSASWAGRGPAKSSTLRSGESLGEGSAIKTGADSRVVFSPVPGTAVSMAKRTSVSLLRLAVTKSGDTVQSRDAVMKLDIGTLSFSSEPRNTTRVAVQTPLGTISAEGAAGTIALKNSSLQIASLSGKMTFAITGGSHAPISIEQGSFLVASGGGTNATIRIVNVITRTTTDFSAAGAQLSTRDATVQDLESARGFFEATLAHAAIAVGYGLLSTGAVAEISATLTNINQSLAIAGIASVEAPAVGSSTPASAGTASEGATAPAGFTSGSANPANLSGQIISPER